MQIATDPSSVVSYGPSSVLRPLWSLVAPRPLRDTIARVEKAREQDKTMV